MGRGGVVPACGPVRIAPGGARPGRNPLHGTGIFRLFAPDLRAFPTTENLDQLSTGRSPGLPRLSRQGPHSVFLQAERRPFFRKRKSGTGARENLARAFSRMEA